MKIGIVVNQPTGIKDTVALAKRVEDLGYHALWLTSGGGGDPIPMLAVLAQQTSRVLFGTSIVQTLPRHPVIMAQEAHVIAQLAPGRLRLGIGPSHKPLMEAYGLPFDHPLGRLEEYVRILQALFTKGEVKFAGRFYTATAALPSPITVPVMIGALRRNAFELAGRVSDGAITWLCPAPFVRGTGAPALRAAAQAAGRAAPPLIAHAAVCVSDNAEQVRATVRATIGNIRLPYYQQMLVDAGYPEAVNGQWTDKLVDEVILWGDAARVKERLAEMSAAGADEILIKVVQTGGLDGLEPTLKAIAPLCAA
jgi:F420-dependent oxidoreductase-like protein